MSPPSPPQPLYFDGLLGFLHRPDAGESNGVGVVMCSPFGYDDLCMYRPRREWARALAAAGHPTVRFDLPGTGDSVGSPRDPARLDAWSDAVGTAAAELALRTGCRRVTAVGVGLGGMLAYRAAALGAEIDDLVLWATPSRGRLLLRELRAFARMESYAREAADAPAACAVEEGGLEAGGFLMTPETVASLEALDLTRLNLPAAARRRVLLLERDGISVDARLRGHLEATGVAVDVAPGPGYVDMTGEPHQARPPLEVIDTTARWLERGSPTEVTVAVRGAKAPPAPAAEGELEIESGDGTGLREALIEVELPSGRLFGVLARPEASETADFCAVFLNVGAIRRVGPGRMWVEAARRWAARGVPSLRLDVEGIGDADGESGQYAEVTELYRPELVDQVVAGLDALAAHGLPRRFVMVGLCSGAYLGFHTALRDERVRAVLMLNPRALMWDASIELAREARKFEKLGRASQWRRLGRGEIRLANMLKVLWALVVVAGRSVVGAPGRLAAGGRARAAGGDELDLALDRLRDSGRQILLAFASHGEPLYEELKRQGRLARLERWPNVRLETIAGQDHILSATALQRQAHALLDDALERERRRLTPARELTALSERAPAHAGGRGTLVASSEGTLQAAGVAHVEPGAAAR